MAVRRNAALAGMALALAASSCSVENCKDLKEGNQLRITVIEPRPGWTAPDSPPETCHGTIGFPTSQQIVATVVRFGGDHGCASGIPELEPADGWSWELSSTDFADGDDILEGRYAATKGDCGGDLRLDVYGGSIPSEAPEPGQDGTTFMHLHYIPNAIDGGPEECPGQCSIELTVAIEESCGLYPSADLCKETECDQNSLMLAPAECQEASKAYYECLNGLSNVCALDMCSEQFETAINLC